MLSYSCNPRSKSHEECNGWIQLSDKRPDFLGNFIKVRCTCPCHTEKDDTKVDEQ